MSREAAASLAESRDPLEDLLRIRAEDSSDELWARAVWLSSCGASSDQVARVFGAALSRAKKRAPIYVSFGDALTALGLFDSLAGGMELVVGRLTADTSAHAKDLEHAPNEQERAKVLEKVFSDSFKKSANQLLTQLLKNESAARQKAAACYLAAVAEDPEYKPAWQRLAFLLKGAPRDQVVADFVRRDPENAVPYYLRAIAEIDRGDLGAALSSVQLGNGKTVCRTYPGAMPAGRRSALPGRRPVSRIRHRRPTSTKHRPLLRRRHTEHKLDANGQRAAEDLGEVPATGGTTSQGRQNPQRARMVGS
jgi:tetratricopeptide (TPR) repeat protein